ncbi:xanthine dehydrogenase family protein subunit M [Ramlibacter sp. 2FC]|uniref:FAD binding domain-containing protein n=1 Tax=Ramlibacter sp. 2FC TaxID=2502188 RepID=UPI0010F6F129|nr:xanthine dehydrogenase family protein subunit M [Ramlibacter sp. 2FC]
MKPPKFEFVRADSVKGAIAALSEYGEGARILAGGQSLVPMMNLRIARPTHLIDITRIPGLDRVEEHSDGVVIGAAARHYAVEGSDVVKRVCPLVPEALKLVAHETIRHRGTVCGSLAHADPHSELPAVAVALDAVITIAGPLGERHVPASEFYFGPFMTAVGPSEMVTAVKFPAIPSSAGYAIAEFARTHGNFAIAGAVSIIELDADGSVRRAALSLFGLASRPLRASMAEQALLGKVPTAEVIERAAAAALEGVECSEDMHGSAAYRTNIGRVYAARVIGTAVARANAGERQ